MNRLPRVVGALVAVALVFSVIWTPWVAVAVFTVMLAWFAHQVQRRDEAVAALLPEPGAVPRAFDEAVLTLRGTLRDNVRVLQDRDDEIARRKLVTNAVPDGLFLLDATNRIQWCNQAALQMHSLDAFRDMSKPIAQFIRAPEFAAYLANDQQPEPIITTGGRSLLFHLERSEDGGRTEREKLDRMRRDFVANVSHELRTPLTVVGGFIETLTDLPLTATERARYLALISTQTGNMQRLVEDLLTLARMENDQLPPDTSQTDLATVAREALADAEALSAGAHHFNAHIEQARVLGSASELRSALNNLLSNAVRYTPSGGRIALTVSSANAAGDIVVEVRDSGAGIKPEHIPRLTERFYRVDRSRSRDTGGTGLGLAIVKHVAQRHQGSLNIESVVGGDAHGSTFRLQIPAAPTV
jgi:two-component system, OmpR family, phosphate regulon sensor histidine kinase PhoR